ncbi:MAG TPA: HAMP domain-containing sensor histidine kinase [Pyrinomonadaceae bacterium]|nr:HAMP domain-containing sensor histidine kinase [Pyrinomonadaceae bacterium]
MKEQTKKVLETVTVEGGGGLRAITQPGAAGAEPSSTPGPELQALSAEVISLLYEQAFGTGESRGEAEVCEAFADILLRHWDLCCVLTFLREEPAGLRPVAGRVHSHVDDAAAREVARTLAAEVERTGQEFGHWPGSAARGGAETEGAGELGRAFERAGLEAGVAVPITAHGALSGVVVVLTTNEDRLRSALDGVRCVAPAIVITIGNARRSEAVWEQHRRIESLVGELRQRTAELEEANRELQRVGRYRSLFLARMSHELRTPLTSILGFAEILLDQEALTAAQRRFCEKIQASGFQLQSSLNHLVDLSRLEAGQTEMFLHEFSLRETLRESCSAVARLAQKQEVTLNCQPSAEVGHIVSDEGKFRQVLYNFLAFAIGRSPAGCVVRIETVPAEGGRFDLDIIDEGEPLTDPSHLFDAVDVDAPNERGTNMNELGLVIAHRLLGVLGGKASLRPLEPRGLAVRLNLPVRPAEG